MGRWYEWRRQLFQIQTLQPVHMQVQLAARTSGYACPTDVRSTEGVKNRSGKMKDKFCRQVSSKISWNKTGLEQFRPWVDRSGFCGYQAPSKSRQDVDKFAARMRWDRDARVTWSTLQKQTGYRSKWYVYKKEYTPRSASAAYAQQITCESQKITESKVGRMRDSYCDIEAEITKQRHLNSKFADGARHVLHIT